MALRALQRVAVGVTDDQRQEFLKVLQAHAQTVAIAAACATTTRDLAAEVRRLQREHPGARAAWAAYCEEQANGIKDPLRHSVSSLREFLNQFDL